MAIVDKIEKNAAGQIIFRDISDNIIQTEPPTLGIRMFRSGQPDEGVVLYRGAEPIIVLDASKIKRSQIDPDPEVTGLTLTQQTLAELLVSFFFN